MKKIFTALLILSTCINLYGCNFSKEKYIPQENINLNYNNIFSNGMWITNNNICFPGDKIYNCHFLADKNGTKKIFRNTSAGDVQQYGNTIYMMEFYNNVDPQTTYYSLNSYDLETGKVSKISKFKNCKNYMVLDDTVFVLETDYSKDIRNFFINKYSLTSKTLTLISDSVLSFGVIDNQLVYLSEENNVVSIFRYDNENDKIEKIGESTTELLGFEPLESDFIACYTSEYIFLICTDYSNDSSTFLKYSIKTKEVSQKVFNGCIENFNSYKDYSYFTMFKSEYSEENEVYKISNETFEKILLGKFIGGSKIFVGSDDGVYVWPYNGNLSFYSEHAECKIIYK